jgi:hypothetical protein
MSEANVEDALQRANTNITHVQNPWGIGDGVGAQLQFDGRTTRSTDFNPDGTCSNLDGFSVTGFGTLPSALASACTSHRVRDGQDEIVASDIRYNKADYDWTAEITSSCNRRWDVEGVGTHERGHTFGIDHVR